METFLTYYLIVGVLFSSYIIITTRDMKTTTLGIIVDFINLSLFYPYILQETVKKFLQLKKIQKLHDSLSKQEKDLINLTINNLKKDFEKLNKTQDGE